jgi:PAS domain S-box-containing protein
LKNTKSYNSVAADASLYLEAVFEAATDAIITISDRGLIETVNPAAEKLFGYEEAELVGKNVSMLMTMEHQGQHDQYLRNYLSTGQAKIIGTGREVEARCKDGRVIPIRLAVSQARINDRIIFAGILHDLTEVKEAEAKIRKLNEELEQKVKKRTEELVDVVNKLLQANQQLSYENKERRAAEDALRKSEKELRKLLEKEKELSQLKSRFVTMASHEFRTPLSAILSSADLIELYAKKYASASDDKKLKHVGRIKAAVHNLTNILNDFLSLSKLEEERVQVNLVAFKLTEFCEEVVDELKGLLKNGQEIRHSCPVPTAEVLMDKKILKNIMYNLLSNAIKYSGENAPIECGIRLSENEVHIDIRDYGIGIPPEDQQHLFTRFFRAHNAENIQGTGLGLNIVRKYLDLLDGDITFESELGKGTKFSLRIPAQIKQLN